MMNWSIWKNDIRVLEVSIYTCDAGWNWHTDRAWTGFHLWVVIAGTAYVRKVEGQAYTLRAGDFFMFDLSQEYFCTQCPTRPLVVYDVFFHVEQAEAFQKCVISPYNAVGRLSMNVGLLDELRKSWMRHDYEEEKIWLAPLFSQFFAERQTEENHVWLEEICMDMVSHPEKPWRLEELCRRAGYSPNHFIRLFKEYKGMTPYAYHINAKIDRAKQMILYSRLNFSQIAEVLGYADSRYFSRQFRERTGMTPSQYRVSRPSEPENR